jgi:hypothetical protein
MTEELARAVDDGEWQTKNLFFVVLARDAKYVKGKIEELERLGVLYCIICGDEVDDPRVTYRRPIGKYDAINYSLTLIPRETEIVIYNDVDTKIIDYKALLRHLNDGAVGIVYAPEAVMEGPQSTFYKIFNPVRAKIPLSSSGELMAIKKRLLERILPLKPCKAEDTYMMFKALELGQRVVQCDECPIPTERTKESRKEEQYKRKTVTGIYQALSYTKPPPITRLAYVFLPVVSPLLLVLGVKGYYMAKGIVLGALDYLRGDKKGSWNQDYL